MSLSKDDKNSKLLQKREAIKKKREADRVKRVQRLKVVKENNAKRLEKKKSLLATSL